MCSINKKQTKLRLQLPCPQKLYSSNIYPSASTVAPSDTHDFSIMLLPICTIHCTETQCSQRWVPDGTTIQAIGRRMPSMISTNNMAVCNSHDNSQ